MISNKGKRIIEKKENKKAKIQRKELAIQKDLTKNNGVQRMLQQ